MSRQVGRRKDFRGLVCLNRQVLLRASAKLDPLARAQIAALHEGAFMTAKQQSKFDTFQSGNCLHCGQPDDLDHRILHCPALAQAREGHDEALAHSKSTSQTFA